MKKALLITVLLMLTLVSCKRIPLYDPATDVYLKLDLKLAIDVELSADIEIAGHTDLEDKVHGKMPELVRACFYDPETHKLVSEDFLPPEGGFIILPAGVYDLIVYSMGTEATQVTGMDNRGSAYAFTSPTGTKVKARSKAGDEDPSLPSEFEVIYEPDHIFVGRVNGVVIPVHPAGEEHTIVIESEMTPLLETYTFEVKNVNGAGNIQKADVYITGQAPGKYLWDGRQSAPPVAIYFQSDIDPEKGHLFSVFNTFGKFPYMTNNVFLNVLVETGGGGKYQWVFDVTDQFDNPDNVGHEIIIDEPVDVPGPEERTGGFLPTVSDWDVEIVEIPIS